MGEPQMSRPAVITNAILPYTRTRRRVNECIRSGLQNKDYQGDSLPNFIRKGICNLSPLDIKKKYHHVRVKGVIFKVDKKLVEGINKENPQSGIKAQGAASHKVWVCS